MKAVITECQSASPRALLNGIRKKSIIIYLLYYRKNGKNVKDAMPVSLGKPWLHFTCYLLKTCSHKYISLPNAVIHAC